MTARGKFEDNHFIHKTDPLAPPSPNELGLPRGGWRIDPDSVKEGQFVVVHPTHPSIVFLWRRREDTLTSVIVYNNRIQTRPFICHRRELFSEFASNIFTIAETPFTKINPLDLEIA